MAYKLMIQGTMSSAGKSFIVTALCRMFCDLGYKVAPFKSQNMSLNSGVTFDGCEMGRAQIAQAEAARTVADVRMNPILLKPNSDVGSQVIVMGKHIGNMNAREYYDYKKNLVPVIKNAFKSLEEEYDVIIVEGAGSPAEINLKENDIVNMGLAKMLDLPVLLVGDIDLGGVFAQLLGTLEWLTSDEREMIKGLIINKFRGDVTLLASGIEMLEDRCKKSVVGVVPYSNAQIDEEDSVTRKLSEDKADMNDVSDKIVINVIRLPHLSNFTDFDPLERVSNVIVNYISDVPTNKPDLLIIPGTKNTIDDLGWLKETGLFSYIIEVAKCIPIIGICGGYQMLGMSVSDPYGIEVNGHNNENIKALCLIDQKTILDMEKTLKKVSGVISGNDGFFSCLNNKKYDGYEIHLGITETTKGITNDSYSVFGTYVHGIFDKAEVTETLVNALREKKGLPIVDLNLSDYVDTKDEEYNIAARCVKEAIDVNKLFEIMGIDN